MRNGIILIRRGNFHESENRDMVEILMNIYQTHYYTNRDNRTRSAARVILGLLLPLLPPVESAIDIGCGVGTWLSVLKENGAGNILGIDGPWVDKKSLVIPPESLITRDLSGPMEITQKFDLAISLELAEHLHPEFASNFIASLTKLADFVLFSAAIPFQGGRNHFNQQWPEYWANLFKKLGYHSFDVIRHQIWNEEHIPVHYRQNIILYIKESRIPDTHLEKQAHDDLPLALVHPHHYLNGSVTGSGALFVRALRSRIRRGLR